MNTIYLSYCCLAYPIMFPTGASIWTSYPQEESVAHQQHPTQHTKLWWTLITSWTKVQFSLGHFSRFSVYWIISHPKTQKWVCPQPGGAAYPTCPLLSVMCIVYSLFGPHTSLMQSSDSENNGNIIFFIAILRRCMHNTFHNEDDFLKIVEV